MGKLIKEPDHIALSVKDPYKMADFYHGVLGLELLREDEFKTKKAPFMSVRVDSMVIDLIPDKKTPGAEEGRQRVNHFCLRLEDTVNMDDLKTYLQENKVTITDEADHNWGAFGYGPSVYVLDPENNSVELKLYPELKPV